MARPIGVPESNVCTWLVCSSSYRMKEALRRDTIPRLLAKIFVTPFASAFVGSSRASVVCLTMSADPLTIPTQPNVTTHICTTCPILPGLYADAK